MQFSDKESSNKHHLLAGFNKMWNSYKSGLCGDTYDKQIAHFGKWQQHIEKTGLQDVWLQSLSRADQNFIIAGFAQEIRENNYGKIKTKKKLMADTVAATISSISSTFRENGFGNPTLDADNQKSIFLQRQLRGFKREDPLPQGQQCVPLSFIKTIFEDDSSALSIALGQLISGALFFACRSCENSRVNNGENRKTKILTLEDLKFFKNNVEVENLQVIHKADFIQITFVSQKTEVKYQSIIQHKSSFNLCPVKSWALLKQRILSYNNTSIKSKVNTFSLNNRLVEITSEEVRRHLRKHILFIDPLQNHYKINKIGTHSIRTSFANILHSVGIDKVTVMMIGRWASDAYMRYIRYNLADFSKHISTRMVKSENLFYDIPTRTIIHKSTTSNRSHFHGPISLFQTSHSNEDTRIYNVWN